MDSTLPETAVLIAAFNAAPTLARAVQSALAQPETVEVCIVDDGSSDDTPAVARALSERDGRVVVVAQANAGPAAARNAAIAATTAPWLAILDADDFLLPGRLGALLAQAGTADFIADALIRTPEGAPTPPAPNSPLTLAPLTLEAFALGNLGKRSGPLDLGFLKPVFRRAFLDQHDLRYRADMRLGEDYELYARALTHGARFLVGGPAGYISVEREGSLSKAHSEDDLLKLRDCDAALDSIRALTPAERRALRQRWTGVDCRLQWRRLISAVKRRDPGAAIATFHSLDAAAYLAARLGEQVVVRTGRLFSGDRGLSTKARA